MHLPLNFYGKRNRWKVDVKFHDLATFIFEMVIAKYLSVHGGFQKAGDVLLLLTLLQDVAPYNIWINDLKNSCKSLPVPQKACTAIDSHLPPSHIHPVLHFLYANPVSNPF